MPDSLSKYGRLNTKLSWYFERRELIRCSWLLVALYSIISAPLCSRLALCIYEMVIQMVKVPAISLNNIFTFNPLVDYIEHSA